MGEIHDQSRILSNQSKWKHAVEWFLADLTTLSTFLDVKTLSIPPGAYTDSPPFHTLFPFLQPYSHIVTIDTFFIHTLLQSTINTTISTTLVFYCLHLADPSWPFSKSAKPRFFMSSLSIRPLATAQLLSIITSFPCPCHWLTYPCDIVSNLSRILDMLRCCSYSPADISCILAYTVYIHLTERH